MNKTELDEIQNIIENTDLREQDDVSDYHKYINTPRFESIDVIESMLSDFIKLTNRMKEIYRHIESHEFDSIKQSELWDLVNCIQKQIQYHRSLPPIWKKYPDFIPEEYHDYIIVNKNGFSGQDAIHFPNDDPEIWQNVKFFTKIDDLEKTCLKE